MEILAFDSFDSPPIEPSGACPRCGTQARDCFCIVSATAPGPAFTYPVTNAPTFSAPPVNVTIPSRPSSKGTHSSGGSHFAPRPPAPPLEPPCTCLRDALLVSEQLHHHQQSIATLPLDQTLSTARRAVNACEQYMRCGKCAESLNSILCLNALQQAAACYRHLATARTAIPGGGEGAWIFRCRIGSFRAEVMLREDVWNAILNVEIVRAVHGMEELERTLIQRLEKERGRERRMDELTAKYHQGLVGVLARELVETAKLINR